MLVIGFQKLIISRAPLRIPIAGGGTDLPSYFLGRGTSWISVAINKYCYTQINQTFDKHFLLKYSLLEKVMEIEEIKHNLIRESLTLLDVNSPLELTFTADLPGGTGLGSSSSFLVSLLQGLYSYKKMSTSAEMIAQASTQIEMINLNEPIGLQDQYISALGGFKEFHVHPSGDLKWNDLLIPKDTLMFLQNNLLLYYTGYTRKSKTILQEQKSLTMEKDPRVIENLDFVKSQVELIKSTILDGNLDKLGFLFNEHWNRKKMRSTNMSNGHIDKFYNFALSNGALGGKLIGAGGGGFVLLVSENRTELQEKLKITNFREIPFEFISTGAQTIYED